MPYVITSSCRNCKYTYCAAVCPVDAFKEGPEYLVIDPDSCIDCNACESECPVNAIYPEDAVPESEKTWIQKNADEAPQFPMINTARKPLKGEGCIDPSAD